MISFKKSDKKGAALKISKGDSSLMILAGISSFIIVFSLLGIKSMISQASYQGRVIKARNASIDQLNKNIANANILSTHYSSVFEGNSPANVIGGKNDKALSSQPPNGDNGTIILHALPTSYDFPALLTSVSKILTTNSVGGQAIGGSDLSVTFKSDPSSSPQPTSVDLNVSGTATYTNAQKLINDFEKSIRPYDIKTLSLNGNQSSMALSFDVTTYYQPAKTTTLTSKEIK